jgi:predicted permease
LDTLQVTLLGEDEPELLSSLSTTGSLFTILGVDPVLGRNFSAEEQRPGGDPRVVLLSHDLWQQRFAGDPEVVGARLNLDGDTWTVVGVLPAGFELFTSPDVWLPFVPDPEYPRGDHRIEAFGRLLPGVSLHDARADMEAIAARLDEQYVEFDPGWSVELVPFPEWLVGSDVERVAAVLMAAVALLLLLACANVSNLLIAQTTGRRREIGLRAALGAGRGRIARQLLTESVALAIPGALLGLALALWAVPVIGRLSAEALPRIDEVTVDGPVLAFTLAATFLTGLVFGSAPALNALRGDLHATVKGGGRDAGGRAGRLRDGLVVGQIALAMILLVGAGLLVNSFIRLLRVDPGFDSENVLTADIGLPVDRYSEGSPEAAAFYREVLERVEALPGVASAGATMVNPFRGWNPSNEVALPEALEQSEFVRVRWRAVTHGFFAAMDVPLLRGRVFEHTETDGVPVVISAALAERLWPGEDPIGEQIRWSHPRGSVFTVIGVVGPVRDQELQVEAPPTVYLPQQMVGWPHMTLIVRTAGDPILVAASVRSEVWGVDENIPVPEMQPLSGNLEDAVAGPRFNAQWMGFFAFAALSMASMGIYGVISYSVARRTREIGIRLALGAQPGCTMRMVLGDGLRLIVIGVAVGALGAFGVSRFLEGMLFQTGAVHPATFVSVAAILAVVATFASYVPARRATRVEPMVALRTD